MDCAKPGEICRACQALVSAHEAAGAELEREEKDCQALQEVNANLKTALEAEDQQLKDDLKVFMRKQGVFFGGESVHLSGIGILQSCCMRWFRNLASPKSTMPYGKIFLLPNNPIGKPLTSLGNITFGLCNADANNIEITRLFNRC